MHFEQRLRGSADTFSRGNGPTNDLRAAQGRGAATPFATAAAHRPPSPSGGPSAGIVEPSWACYKRRLTLRCSGRQPGVRPVAAAELKYR